MTDFVLQSHYLGQLCGDILHCHESLQVLILF